MILAGGIPPPERAGISCSRRGRIFISYSSVSESTPRVTKRRLGSFGPEAGHGPRVACRIRHEGREVPHNQAKDQADGLAAPTSGRQPTHRVRAAFQDAGDRRRRGRGIRRRRSRTGGRGGRHCREQRCRERHCRQRRRHQRGGDGPAGRRLPLGHAPAEGSVRPPREKQRVRRGPRAAGRAAGDRIDRGAENPAGQPAVDGRHVHGASRESAGARVAAGHGVDRLLSLRGTILHHLRGAAEKGPAGPADGQHSPDGPRRLRVGRHRDRHRWRG